MEKYEFFRNKTILITGGTGSFGKAMSKKLILDTQCKKVIVFSRDELKQWEMQQSDEVFRDPRMRYFLGDIRDESRLLRAFNEVDLIVHAAALKQVPAAEYNPSEFVNTNVLGAMNIINAAINCGVDKVIALSTDKAVNPVNLYGATKLCSDKLFVAGNAYVGAKKKPIFSVVRYGNVFGSRGSIIPLWRKMVEEGVRELPVTDVRMTRFWITLDQSVEFVLKCFLEQRGAEIFVPKIPSMKIVDLANVVAPGMPHKILGIRAGEKLHELLISTEDARHTLEFDDYFVIIPEIYSRDAQALLRFMVGREGKHTAENFSYASDTNTRWVTPEQMREMLNG